MATFARSQVPVLVSGETGTGKELIASAIHQLSGRPGPFVAVNCGAIAPNLVESELFGYRKGAFSGALEDRPGLVRSSEHGTLLLDEIGDLPLAAQAALLRVLQESEVLPVGGTRPVKVDLRVVAATHRDLGALAAQDRFRRDLLARLDGARIMLPALRVTASVAPCERSACSVRRLSRPGPQQRRVAIGQRPQEERHCPGRRHGQSSGLGRGGRRAMTS